MYHTIVSLSRAHLLEAVCKGVKMVTFDNIAEIEKCAGISKKIQLVPRSVD
jgi:ornithine decarboxylase